MSRPKGIKALSLAAALLLLSGPGLAARKELTVRIWLFQGTMSDGHPEPRQVEILPFSTTPELTSLRAAAGGPEDAFKAAVVDALLEAKDLRALDDLFLFKQTQREDRPFPGKVVLGRQIAYRIDLAHEALSPARMAFRIILSRTREGVLRPEKSDRMMLRNAFEATRDEEKMDLLMDQALTVGFDDPVAICVPRGNQPYFLIFRLTADEPVPRRRTAPTVRLPAMPELVPAPRPIERPLPAYPDELRRRGVKGDVGLRLAIDEKGAVRMVQVLSPLHPYLDYSASQAFWQWTFEPVLRKEKPAPAAFDYAFRFDPEAYAAEISFVDAGRTPHAGAAALEALERILAACADYLRELSEAALFYIAEETIREITHALGSPERLAELALRGRDFAVQVAESADGRMTGWVVDKPQIMNRRTIERLTYICDYQMIRRFGEIEERRIVLRENGRRIADRVELLEESRYSALAPVTAAASILAEDRQPLFNYRILKEDKVNGKSAYVIEAVPKLGDADGVRLAKAWVEKESHRILKCETEGVPLDGYEEVLNEATLLNIRPYFLRTHEFRIEHGGILFPDRTAVRIEYPSLMPGRRESKSRIDIAYKDFKFFTVETGHAIRQ
jgi:TonB family protein